MSVNNSTINTNEGGIYIIQNNKRPHPDSESDSGSSDSDSSISSCEIKRRPPRPPRSAPLLLLPSAASTETEAIASPPATRFSSAATLSIASCLMAGVIRTGKGDEPSFS
ncbi:unnamed protein product [Mucor hiemalis]